MKTLENSPREWLRRYFEAVNAERWDNVVAAFSEDAVLTVPTHPPKRGKAEILRFYEAVPRLFPEHRDRPVFVCTEGNQAIACIEFTGRRPDGSAVHFWAVDRFVFANGLITELLILFDPAHVPFKLLQSD